MLYRADFHFSKLHTAEAFDYLLGRIRPYWSRNTRVTVFFHDQFVAKKRSGIELLVRDFPQLREHVFDFVVKDAGSSEFHCYLGNLEGNYEWPQSQFEVSVEEAQRMIAGIPRRYDLNEASVHILNLNFLGQDEAQFGELSRTLANLNQQIFNTDCGYGFDRSVGSQVKFHSDWARPKRSLWCEIMTAKPELKKREKPLPPELTAKEQGAWHPLRTRHYSYEEYVAQNQQERSAIVRARQERQWSFEQIRKPIRHTLA